MIWGFATCEPRVVEIDFVSGILDLEYKTLAPALMHACRESRAIGGKFYFHHPQAVRLETHMSIGLVMLLFPIRT